jgi:hypothetical protein
LSPPWVKPDYDKQKAFFTMKARDARGRKAEENLFARAS